MLMYAVDHSIVECRHHESVENNAATNQIKAKPLIGPKHNSQFSTNNGGADDGLYFFFWLPNNVKYVCILNYVHRCLFYTISRTRRSGSNFGR